MCVISSSSRIYCVSSKNVGRRDSQVRVPISPAQVFKSTLKYHLVELADQTRDISKKFSVVDLVFELSTYVKLKGEKNRPVYLRKRLWSKIRKWLYKRYYRQLTVRSSERDNIYTAQTHDFNNARKIQKSNADRTFTQLNWVWEKGSNEKSLPCHTTPSHRVYTPAKGVPFRCTQLQRAACACLESKYH